jgi:hypothetical protein
MASGYVPLPRYENPQNSMLDFSTLNNAVQNFGQTTRQNLMAEYQVGRDKVQDARASAAAGREAERFAMQKDEYNAEKKERALKSITGVAQLIDQEQDPGKRSQMWGQLRSTVKDFDTDLQGLGVDPNDHINGPKFFIARQRGYVEPKSVEPKIGEIYDEATGQPRKVLMGADGKMTPVGGVRAPEKRDAGLSVIEKKQVFDSEDALPALDATVSALNRAKELNSKTFEGMASGLRGSIGTAFAPNSMAGEVVGQVLDRGASEATSEWGKVMNMEAIQSMAATLKGATTNFELQEFVNILADPSTPPPIRARTIDRMLALAEGRRQTARRRIEELRSTGLRPSNGAPPPREQTNPQTGEPANPTVIDLGDGFSVEFGQ